ncbi:MAG: aldehyde dehydrogenase family protein, partial [Maritimibacter sp.]
MRLLRGFSYIGGKWVAGEDGASFAVSDPANGQHLGDVAALTARQSGSAVEAAEASFAPWAQMLPQDRSAILRSWFELIIAAKEDLARIMVLEQGKPLSEARGEIDYAASFIDYYAEEAKRPNIEGVTSHLPDAEMELWLEPVGVVALITPWNFPA